MDFSKLLSYIFPFGKKKGPLLGIDIGSSSIKLLTLRRNYGQYHIEAFAYVPLPEGGVVDREIKNPAVVIDGVKKAISLAHTNIHDVAVALADSSVITKIVTMDSNIPETELEAQIFHEASQNIPYPIQEVRLDFELLGLAENDPRKIRVALAASRSETVESYINVITQAGLTLKIIDVESFVLTRACALLDKQIPKIDKETFAILSIGAERTFFIVAKKLIPIFNRSENFGSRKILEAMEPQKVAGEGITLNDNDIKIMVQKFKETVTQCVRRSIQFFSTTGNEDEIQHIILVGGGALIPDLAAYVEQQVEIPSIVANPLAEMTYSSGIDPKKLIQIAPSLMQAIGLAMRSLDEGA